jgi:hypothetical protein
MEQTAPDLVHIDAESEEVVAKIKSDMQAAFAAEKGDYITPARARELIFDVLQKHADAGNIKAAPDPDVTIERDENGKIINASWHIEIPR